MSIPAKMYGMDERAVVTCILRHGTSVLLLRRSESVGSYAGLWGGVSGYSEGSPEAAARWEIDEEVGLLDAVTLVRAGDPVTVVDETYDTRWSVHPYLFECEPDAPSSEDSSTDPPTIEPNEEIADWAWVQPPAILDRETVPKLWETYDSVGPSVETVRTDADHGAAYISLRALEVLRDRAAALAADIDLTTSHNDPIAGSDRYDTLSLLARALREARPSMGVIRTRIDRVMADAGSTPAEIRDRTIDACSRTVRTDREAATNVVASLGDRILTLSRSGTVLDALNQASPTAIFVAESRPAREGISVAETLSKTTDADVTLCIDAAIAHVLERERVETVLVGADSVRRDGTAINKVGTRLAALAANDLDIDCYVVCSRDKITPRRDEKPAVEFEDGPSAQVYDGDEGVGVTNPTFETVPFRLIDDLITEDGHLDVHDVERIAAEHADNASWMHDRTGSSSAEW
ncbi:MAG: NUDIX domain-containing protein [Natronomonas sp.]